MAGADRKPMLVPVLLSGGAGSRLWPLSRERYPKQLLNLVGEYSMIQETVRRVSDPNRFAPPLLICNEEHRFIVAEQMRQMDIRPRQTILEPFGRNTAPAVAVAALTALATDPEALLLILPADHLIRNQATFLAAVEQAVAAAATGYLVTFGITPTAPETGYGYIQSGAPLDHLDGVFRVAAFIEKPERQVAERFLAGDKHYWNSGMFLFPAAHCLAELERLIPAVPAACRAALAKGANDLDFFRLDRESFTEAPDISIDHALMEHTETAAVVPADMGWTDVGAWSQLWEVAPKDEAGNVCIGDVATLDSRACYIRSEHALTAVVGLDDVVVVVTDDAILVTAKDQAPNVKALVQTLRQAGRREPLEHRRIHRPWGFFQCLHGGERFQVKRLTINPGACLSLQMHYHRAEHWVVVNGTAMVTRGEEKILLRENESIHIPLGTVHRLENPGRLPLNLIEVQSGAYLGEDDIVRFEDTYGRIP